MDLLVKYWLWIQTTQLDVPLQFFGSILCVAISYYIISKIWKPADKASGTLMVLYAFSISETVMIVRKIIQFFIDFFTGSNLMQTQAVPDDHWLFKVVGFGMSAPEQRTVMDMGEDFFLSTLGTLLASLGLFVYLRKNNKVTSKKDKLTISQRLKAFPERCREKYVVEKHKLDTQTNLADRMVWWCVRALMLNAFLTMENRAEAVLLLVNFFGTVAITLLHIFSPSDSFLGRIHYRIQTLLAVIVFWGSYGGNYIVLYGFIDKYDKKLHFLAGVISVLAAYYLASEFIGKKTKGQRVLTGVFAPAFSFMIIPVHEMTEFVGDFLWGTVNQGYCWIPEADSTFYKIFGLGAENIALNSVFDTMNDALFAATSTLVTAIALWAVLAVKNKTAGGRLHLEQEKIACS